MLPFLLIGLFVSIVLAAPAKEPLSVNLGIKFEKRADIPTLVLPYGTWKASNYDLDADIYTFKNIRFAAPPTGQNRWKKPQSPENVDGVQDGSYGPSCIQQIPKGLNLLGPGNQSPAGGALNQFLGGIPLPLLETGDEDCLFLDLYVPGDAVRNPNGVNLPVIVYIYGGAFTFGSKDALNLIGFYSGKGIIEQTGGKVIYVAGNYRVGAYGFLAGSTMEKDGQPNAGFWDQRAVFQWVQDHISLVGGDKTNVNAWGESAGASSVLHHLTAQGGKLEPLFKRAVSLSPAYQFMWDRKGDLEDTFQSFASLAGCEGKGVECLRAADADVLKDANDKLIDQATLGSFNVGPATDGDFVRQLAPLEFASGNYYKGLESLIVSHTADESELFVDGHIQTDEQFTAFIDAVFPDYSKAAGINAAIETFFPPVATNKTYSSETARMKAFIRDTSFTCYARFLTDAYAGSTWNLQYSVTPGWHGTDLLPAFWSAYVSFNGKVPYNLIPGFGDLAQTYQSYLTSHARAGDPNTYAKKLGAKAAIEWPRPGTEGEDFTNVLNAGDAGFSLVTDTKLPRRECEFVRNLAAAITNVGGYAVPGTEQPQSLVEWEGDSSANY